MKKNPIEIQHLNAADFRQSPFEKVILPLGSLESHGGHLPFGTDALTASWWPSTSRPGCRRPRCCRP